MPLGTVDMLDFAMGMGALSYKSLRYVRVHGCTCARPFVRTRRRARR